LTLVAGYTKMVYSTTDGHVVRIDQPFRPFFVGTLGSKVHSTVLVKKFLSQEVFMVFAYNTA